MLENAVLRYVGDDDGTLTHLIIPIEDFIALRAALEIAGIYLNPLPRTIAELQTARLEEGV
jgi:hypothetical protein